jgi:hypothetical protein
MARRLPGAARAKRCGDRVELACELFHRHARDAELCELVSDGAGGGASYPDEDLRARLTVWWYVPP